MKKVFIYPALFATVFISLLTACTNIVENDTLNAEYNITEQEACKKFAMILSRAVHAEPELRAFIKESAISKFDGTYDVLYATNKWAKISDCTFEDILVKYSDHESDAQAILEAVPEINITLPNWGFFTGNTPEKWDITNDNVFVAYENITNQSFELFDDGEFCAQLKYLEIPSSQTLVVTKNERVKVIPPTKSNENYSYVFTNKAYEPKAFTKAGNWIERDIDLSGWGDTDLIPESEIDNRVIAAYNEFRYYSGDACQRDYIYYGMTTQSNQGVRDDNVRERLYRFRLSNATYSIISDQSNDPFLKNEYYEDSNSQLTPWNQSLARKLWTNGSYLFKFEIFKAEAGQTTVFPESCTIAVLPYEAYDITGCHESYINKTWLRKGEYKYSAQAYNLRARWIYISGNYYLLPWNLTTQSGTIYVRLIEMDETETLEENEEKSFIFTHNTQNSVDANLGISGGDTVKVDLKLGYGYTGANQNQTSEKINIKKTKVISSDELGIGVLDYRTRILNNQASETVNGITYYGYDVNSVSLGGVEVTFLPCVIN